MGYVLVKFVLILEKELYFSNVIEKGCAITVVHVGIHVNARALKELSHIT